MPSLALQPAMTIAFERFTFHGGKKIKFSYIRQACVDCHQMSHFSRKFSRRTNKKNSSSHLHHFKLLPHLRSFHVTVSKPINANKWRPAGTLPRDIEPAPEPANASHTSNTHTHTYRRRGDYDETKLNVHMVSCCRPPWCPVDTEKLNWSIRGSNKQEEEKKEEEEGNSEQQLDMCQ